MIEISMMASVDVIQHWLCHELLTCDTCVHLHVLLTWHKQLLLQICVFTQSSLFCRCKFEHVHVSNYVSTVAFLNMPVVMLCYKNVFSLSFLSGEVVWTCFLQTNKNKRKHNKRKTKNKIGYARLEHFLKNKKSRRWGVPPNPWKFTLARAGGARCEGQEDPRRAHCPYCVRQWSRGHALSRRT